MGKLEAIGGIARWQGPCALGRYLCGLARRGSLESEFVETSSASSSRTRDICVASFEIMMLVDSLNSQVVKEVLLIARYGKISGNITTTVTVIPLHQSYTIPTKHLLSPCRWLMFLKFALVTCFYRKHDGFDANKNVAILIKASGLHSVTSMHYFPIYTSLNPTEVFLETSTWI